MSFKNIPLTFVLTLRQFRGLNHLILRLRDFLLIVLVLVVLGINVFLSASGYIEIDSLKATSLEEISEIRLSTSLGISVILEGESFNLLLMYTRILSGFLYGWCLNSVQRQLRQRQLPILRLVCFVMFKPHSLNRLIMAFLFLSISELDKYIYIYIYIYI